MAKSTKAPTTVAPGKSAEAAASALACIRALMATQRLAVLSTSDGHQPYASLVAFAATADMQQLFFSTARATRKYRNLTTCARAALLIDSRSHRDDDLETATAVTALGPVRELTDQEHALAAARLMERHPQLASFVTAPDSALFAMDIASLQLVTRFQEVTEIHLA